MMRSVSMIKNIISCCFSYKSSIKIQQRAIFSTPVTFSKNILTTCWNCQNENNVLNMQCHHCGVLLAPPPTIDYFVLMDQPIRFDLDLRKLARKFKKLQFVIHPDRFSTKSPEELAHSESWSPLVNQAFSTLYDPMSRALYMLEKFGQPLLEGDQPVLDAEFLLEIMEVNEELDEVECKDDIEDLKARVTEELEKLHETLKEHFDQEQAYEAKLVVAKMQYFHNLRHKIKEKELELGIVD